MGLDPGIRIADFESRYAAAFKTLNLEWLERFFSVEPLDEQILEDGAAIIEHGGAILFALADDAPVGCCALKHQGGGVYELTKMAVTESHQGLGLGRLLGEATIQRFVELGGKTLFLESHDSLVPALKLYESLGFRHTERLNPSPYARSNVYMVWQP